MEFEFKFVPLLPGAADLPRAKKTFSRLGFSLMAFLLISLVLQIAATLLLDRLDLPQTPLVTWGLGYLLPLYGIALPAALLIMRPVARESWEAHPLGFGTLLCYLLICFPIMYGGSMVGTILSGMFSGGTAENPLDSLVAESSLIQTLVLAVFAPLFEEFVFRKQLIDRCRRYGEKTALVFSALCFALFHGNLFQFFYAFGLGLLFAYVYLRTRKLRYPAFLHMCVNFFGSVVSPWVYTHTDLDAIEQLIGGNLYVDLSGVFPMLIFGYALLGFVIAGLVLLIRRRDRVLLLPAPEELPRGTFFRTACVNAGMIAFTAVCAVVIVLSLF